MKRYFLDSNIFLRFFAQDDKKQLERVMDLFNQAEQGRLKLVTGPPVLFETAWTLKSVYKLSSAEINVRLLSICGVQGLEITDRDLVEAAIRMSQDHDVEFADAYIATSAPDIAADAVATFNVKDFRKAGIAVHEW